MYLLPPTTRNRISNREAGSSRIDPYPDWLGTHRLSTFPTRLVRQTRSRPTVKRLDLDLLAILIFVGAMLAVLYYSFAGRGIPTLARVSLGIAVIVALAPGLAREVQGRGNAQPGGLITHVLMLLVAVCW